MPNTRSKATLSVTQTPRPSGNNSQPPSSSAAPVEKNQNKCYGLKITHHGIVKQPVMKKGRRCTCEICGAKFKNSTLFINHYSSTHPLLACKHCSKSYTNLLSLQKHVYTHTADKKSCVSCGRQFAFDSQLAHHRKTRMKKKPHICSYPNCTRDFTHRYDLLKHEQTHCKGVHKCDKCDYSTKDVRNLCQHSRTHTGERRISARIVANNSHSICKKRDTPVFKISNVKITVIDVAGGNACLVLVCVLQDVTAT